MIHIEIKKDSFEVQPSKNKSNAIKRFTFAPKDPSNKILITQVVYPERENEYHYYLSSQTSIKADDSYKYSKGEYLGSSPNNLELEDVEISI